MENIVLNVHLVGDKMEKDNIKCNAKREACDLWLPNEEFLRKLPIEELTIYIDGLLNVTKKAIKIWKEKNENMY